MLVPDRSTAAILKAYAELGAPGGARRLPEGWDGRTAERIGDVFARWLDGDRRL